MIWPLMITLVVGSFGFKAIGVLALGGAVERRLEPLVAFIPAAVFSALIVVMTLEADGELVIDGRVVGVVAGAAAVWRRAPFLAVVLVGMAATAFVRAVS